MKTKEIAHKLVDHCNAGENLAAIKELYADDIASFEVTDPMKETHGKEGVLGKNQWWIENHDVHSAASRGPWVNGDSFIVEHTMDVTFKPTGKRNVMNETALYEVRDGKIAKETFFYDIPGQ